MDKRQRIGRFVITALVALVVCIAIIQMYFRHDAPGWVIALVFLAGVAAVVLTYERFTADIKIAKAGEIFASGIYLVVSGKVDTISPEAGNGEEHRINLVLVIRPIKNGSSEYRLIVLPKERINQGSLTGVSRAINDNHPPFRYEIRLDGSSYLFQELGQDGHKTYELTFNP